MKYFCKCKDGQKKVCGLPSVMNHDLNFDDSDMHMCKTHAKISTLSNRMYHFVDEHKIRKVSDASLKRKYIAIESMIRICHNVFLHNSEMELNHSRYLANKLTKIIKYSSMREIFKTDIKSQKSKEEMWPFIDNLEMKQCFVYLLIRLFSEGMYFKAHKIYISEDYFVKPIHLTVFMISQMEESAFTRNQAREFSLYEILRKAISH